jgi:sorting nexin-4
MHQHVAHPPTQEPAAGLIDNLSDTLLNAFSRVRKPDERFLVMRENVDKFEEGLTAMERLYTKVRNRTSGESFNLACQISLRLNEMETLNLVKT